MASQAVLTYVSGCLQLSIGVTAFSGKPQRLDLSPNSISLCWITGSMPLEKYGRMTKWGLSTPALKEHFSVKSKSKN